MARLRLRVAYDGGAFRGFAPNPGVRTVGGVLADALGRRLGYPVQLTCAGRTDAGVHARGQVVSLEVADEDASPERLEALGSGLSRLCGPDVAVLAIERASSGFDARFSALARAYRYTIWNSSAPDVFRRRTSWHVREPLDVAAMAEASALLAGEHDFASFCSRAVRIVSGAEREAPTTRRVLHARWSSPEPALLLFEIEANSFCRQMVRSIVGTLVDVGRGRRPAGDMPRVLAARDRAAAGPVAPPHGLCLQSVSYP
ncbi:MAG: tRNA pseudouridine(38-40) synthase TruA [bacterium]|nr:tRNA pseudouridine(38-40) synthase TruA [bacterium]MCY3925998.1 tRNA pseudouridine(38-40) synthase TruA [bacterium]